MLELVELRFKNIGRFVEEQVIDFDILGAFVQIDGQNNNTGGSSGAGKSTVFMALDYLLGFKGRPATILQCRYTEEPIWVRGTFRNGKQLYVITRTKGKIEFVVDGNTFKKSDAETEIDRMMGMPRDLFRKVMHKRQDEGGFFLNLGPSDTHDFLMDCMNLSEFKTKYKTAEADAANLESLVEIESQEVAKAQASLSATQDAILALGLPPIQDIHEEVVLELKGKYEGSTIRFSDIKSRCESMVREFEQKRPSTTNGDYDITLRETLETQRKNIEAQIRACLDGERHRQESVRQNLNKKFLERSGIVFRVDQGSKAQEQITKVVAAIGSIRSQKCPTCLQHWANTDAVTAESDLIGQLLDHKKLVADAETAKAELDELDYQISELTSLSQPIVDSRLPDLNADLATVVESIVEDKRRAGELYAQQSEEFRKKLDAFLLELSDFRKKMDIGVEQARGQVDVDRRVYESAAQKLKNYLVAKDTYDVSYNKLKKQEQLFQNHLTKCKTNLENYNGLYVLALESKKAIKLFVACSFEEALQAISEKATKIIRCIPNTKNATIHLEGTRETQDGKILEEVNAVLSVDGEIDVPLNSFSGGERSSTDLAVDLAVIDYIETKTGKGLNIFILDEPFNGLGTVEIEMALAVLKNSNINKKLTIVSHNPEVKEMVQNRLVVIRDGLTSRVA
jgi:ABC-type Na+ transport system ATPase subunit NatA